MGTRGAEGSSWGAPAREVRPRGLLRGGPCELEDVHGRISRSRAVALLEARDEGEVLDALERAAEVGLPLAIAGGRHAMGGQPFRDGGLVLDTRRLSGVTAFDASSGLCEVLAGTDWPTLVAVTRRLSRGLPRPLGIRQKQTGADAMTLGGSVAVSAHGRGLALPPLSADVEAVRVALPDGRLVRASRTERPDLFALVLGGYGLFGVVTRVVLRLAPVARLVRRVVLAEADELPDLVRARVAEGYRYGDFQFAIDPHDEGFLRRGVFACYRPVAERGPAPAGRRLSLEDWRTLVRLAHVDKGEAFRRYAEHYLATDGAVHDSDTMQLAPYLAGYHEALDRELCAGRPGGPPRGSEVLSELYVPREELPEFLGDCAEELRRRGADVIYGTVRWIERDVDAFLAWARERWACVVLNLHTPHTPAGIAGTRETFRALYDLALARGGSFYLTYHPWARADQLRRGHPRLEAFLAEKRRRDPHGRLASDFLRTLRRALAAGGAAPEPRPERGP